MCTRACTCACTRTRACRLSFPGWLLDAVVGACCVLARNFRRLALVLGMRTPRGTEYVYVCFRMHVYTYSYVYVYMYTHLDVYVYL